MLREGARPEIVRDNMGYANIDVTRFKRGAGSVERPEPCHAAGAMRIILQSESLIPIKVFDIAR